MTVPASPCKFAGNSTAIEVLGHQRPGAPDYGVGLIERAHRSDAVIHLELVRIGPLITAAEASESVELESAKIPVEAIARKSEVIRHSSGHHRVTAPA